MACPAGIVKLVANIPLQTKLVLTPAFSAQVGLERVIKFVPFACRVAVMAGFAGMEPLVTVM